MTARTARQLREMNVLLQYHHEYRYGCCEPSAISQGKKHSKECREREAAIAKAADAALADPRARREDVRVTLTRVDSHDDAFPSGTLSDWIAFFEGLKDGVPLDYQDKIEVEFEDRWEGSARLTAWYCRPETDEEFKERFIKERREYLRQAESDERRDRAQLARLKAKYEGGT